MIDFDADQITEDDWAAAMAEVDATLSKTPDGDYLSHDEVAAIVNGVMGDTTDPEPEETIDDKIQSLIDNWKERIEYHESQIAQHELQVMTLKGCLCDLFDLVESRK